MSGISVKSTSSLGTRLAVSAKERQPSLSGSSSSPSLKLAEEPPTRRASCDAAMVEREKHHYDVLRRRISNFVGHSAYEEKLQSGRKLGTTDDEDSSGDEAKFGNFATNYLKGKKQLAEGSHDRMYKWMGFSSEGEMRQKSGNPMPKDINDSKATRKISGGPVTPGMKSRKTSLGPPGGDTKARLRRSSTGTSPRKLANV